MGPYPSQGRIDAYRSGTGGGFVSDDWAVQLTCFGCGEQVMVTRDEIEPLLTKPRVWCSHCSDSGVAKVDRPPGSVTTLYRFFSVDGDLLYVGISHRMDSRLSQHRRAKPWVEVASIELEHFTSREYALEAEAEAIRRELPL